MSALKLMSIETTHPDPTWSHEDLWGLRWELAFSALCRDMGVETEGTPEQRVEALRQVIELRAVRCYSQGRRVGEGYRAGDWV